MNLCEIPELNKSHWIIAWIEDTHCQPSGPNKGEVQMSISPLPWVVYLLNLKCHMFYMETDIFSGLKSEVQIWMLA